MTATIGDFSPDARRRTVTEGRSASREVVRGRAVEQKIAAMHPTGERRSNVQELWSAPLVPPAKLASPKTTTEGFPRARSMSSVLVVLVVLQVPKMLWKPTLPSET